MIAYLEKYDTTVQVPDDIGEKDLSDINENFHQYVGQKPSATPQAALPGQPAQSPAPAQGTSPVQETQQPSPAAEPAPKWLPNFYQSVIEPSLSQVLAPAKVVGSLAERPEAQAFAGKALEEATFGVAKPLIGPLLAQTYSEHPAFATAGQITGGIGSLLEAGWALRAAGLGGAALKAGSAAVEGGFAAGERFIPRAIMTGATFGTRAFISETVKAFEDGGVNLEQFGKDVLKDTAFGAMFGTIGGLSNAAASVSSAGALGFISTKMSGGDNREASLNAAIWAAFETVGSVGKSKELRLEALGHLKNSIGEYVGERNPNIEDKDAAHVASAFVDHAIKKAGFENAEDIAKSGPENLLEGIEKVNQAIRSGQIPNQGPGGAPALPKLPAPVSPETPTAQPPSPSPQSPLQKAVDFVKQMMGIEKTPYAGEMKLPEAAKELSASPERPAGSRWTNEPGSMPGEPIMYLDAPKGDLDKSRAVVIANEGEQGIGYYTVHDAEGNQIGGKFAEPEEAAKYAESKFPSKRPYDDIIKDLKTQGHDIPKIPESAFPEDLKDVYHYENNKAQKAAIEKNLSQITDRLHILGMNVDEREAIYDKYNLTKTNTVGQPVIAKSLPSLIDQPMEDQYSEAYDVLASKRGIDKGDKFDSRTMEDAQTAVNLINGYFSPKSQDILEFAKLHKEISDQHVAQMAYHRGLIDEPNNDLLKLEIKKAKTEHIVGPNILDRRSAYEGDLEKFQMWRDLIGIGIRPPKTGETDEYRTLPIWMRNKEGRPYDEIAQQAEELGLIPEGEDIFSVLRDVRRPAMPVASYSLIPSTPSENVVTRYERFIKQAMDQGLNRPQAEKWARSQLKGKVGDSEGESKLQQREFGASGGVQSFGRGEKQAQELNFSKVPSESRGEEAKTQEGPSQPQTGQSSISQGPAPANEELQRSVFPGPSNDSYKSITGHPDYIKMREQAAEIVNKYAVERRVTPTPDFAHELWQELHDALGSIMRGPMAERAKIAEEVKAKYPDIQREFSVLKDQLYSDKTGQVYFDKNVIGRYAPADTKINYQMAGTLPRITTPRERVPTAGTVPEISSRLKEAADEISHVVNPAAAAPLAAQITREQLGKMARSYDMAEAALSNARSYFESQPKEANLAFIDKLERGQDLSDINVLGINGGQVQTLNEIGRQLRKLLDDKRKEIQGLGTGKMQSFIENYFPHIWDQGEKQVGEAVQKAAKRPFEGSKSFLKKRSIEFTKDGIDLGLTPVSYNPVDLALLKIREMDKYLMAHRTIQEYKAKGLAKYVKIGGGVPDGWQKIDDRISTVFKSPMIAVKEAYDQKMMDDLNGVAKALGIDLERKANIRKHQGVPAGAWGFSESTTPGEPGKITSKFAGPESVIAHELGHQLDNIYGLQDKFLSDNTVDSELTKLANERADGNPSAAFKAYIQNPDEKMAVMLEAYIHAPELMKRTAPTTYSKLEDFLNSDPKLKPLTEVEPSLVLGSRKGEVSAGGAVIAGHIYAQPDAARIINNYLSPGLQKSSIYQSYRYAGNLINQFQLGFSAFHLGFTSLDASVSKFALAINELASGHPMKAAKDAIESPFAAVTNIIRGNDLLQAWRGEGKNSSDDVYAEAMASAGGRARMDQFYATSAFEQMKHHFEAGNPVRGILHIPLTIAELSSKPILEWIVPRQKLGIFADIMKMETENNPGMTHSEMRALAQKAWDSVDNRMGQLVYDNLFWNRTFKDLLMASVRSVGWNLGTIRELAGGAQDYAEYFSNTVQGKKSEFSYRMAYFTALPIVVGMLGAVTQYLRTGKGPQELKDYYFPKTGGVDGNGDPTRISLPSYMKDLYHYTEDPLKTVANKLSPILGMMGQMMENKDYYGTKIRNEDDPLTKQVASEVVYMLKQVTPFSVRNMQKNLETDNKSLFDTVGPWVGITPAPYDINQTKAEKLAHEIAASHQEIGGRTQEQAERSKLLSDLTRQYRRGDPKATDNMYQAYQQGLISHRQMQNAILHAGMTPLQRMVHGFTPEETERVYEKSTDEEKAQIERILQKKMATRQGQFVSQN